MTFLKEFKEFAIKGNVFDMAVGIIIGSAFTKVVNSVVSDFIMPVLSIFIGQINFKELAYVFQEAELDEKGNIIKAAITINYGNLIQTAIDFLIIAFCIYIVVRMFNKLRKKSDNEQDGTVTTPKNIELLAEIRDLLKEKDRK
ncbi:large-conductance mechanosensitive channel [Marivirga tractuosa]|uniref:Large-conductance mechanosensitive channel n=1 Tax=Marivirga tractuosa (strain ATCC 23168 / DSM 4126 / NBRC 15989 / NCIMB 1408 / VKM B-1430 / H-43) TaxID=643867 RepID=E4TTK6_MARTH|nr:large-conductance mechanosensitive channel protein MscL [Marivirga tractuosa]ADR20923.1 large conductance mechanosensitive channel protein [Marivirga tractuosa DSM 4126]BDD14626.1 large-conductance mechanosensitive channel [Marivirga tractuosa]